MKPVVNAANTGRGFRPPLRNTVLSENLKANRRALKALSDCELATGLTADELRAIQLEQKQRVMERRAA